MKEKIEELKKLNCFKRYTDQAFSDVLANYAYHQRVERLYSKVKNEKQLMRLLNNQMLNYKGKIKTELYWHTKDKLREFVYSLNTHELKQITNTQ